MKTCSKTFLLLTALSVSALLSGLTFAENVAMIGSNHIAYQGVEQTAGQVSATAVAMPGSKLIAYRGVETTSVASTEATGSFCSTKPAKNFSAGAIGLLSTRSSC